MYPDRAHLPHREDPEAKPSPAPSCDIIMHMNETNYDVIVIGAGHAGCEAALAAARMDRKTLLVTLNLDRISHMPCNCSIGGPAKGHLAREIDALAGEMGINTDCTLTHIRFVGTGKGPAIQTLRAHADKTLYPRRMRQVIENQENLTLVQGSAEEIFPAKTARNRVGGIRLRDGRIFHSKGVVVTTGTFLNGLMHCGEKRTVGGRHGEDAARTLSDSLANIGIRLGRFKTGTTPRVDKKTIDWDRVEPIPSENCPPFSFIHERLNPPRPLLPCWYTHTTLETHRIIKENLHRSALYGGHIKGVGPRYCPSIEDKIVRFASKDSHPVFLEQEEWDSDWIYVQGMSTSLPEDVQIAFLRSVPGLENIRMFRAGYAVEYDMAYPDQLYPTLESKLMKGLFLAGQINGTSGYEEAGAQGLVAGVNAALIAGGEDPVTFNRKDSYTGVMIDDLVTKGVQDPYRMLTSRAEYRLSLRHDNADMRLTPLARKLGLASEERWRIFTRKRDAIEREMDRLANTFLTPRDNAKLRDSGTDPVGTKVSLREILRRPDINYQWIREHFPSDKPISRDVAEQVEIQTKYEGYIDRQKAQIQDFSKMESILIPHEVEYKSISTISMEGREQLTRIKPISIGQAARIPGVTPADLQMLLIWMKRRSCVEGEEEAIDS
jgi:tRNA uridine 5-carboxymethylaminomethyl modification enzyme